MKSTIQIKFFRHRKHTLRVIITFDYIEVLKLSLSWFLKQILSNFIFHIICQLALIILPLN